MGVLGDRTSSSFFGDEDAPVTPVVLDIEFLEDFVEDLFCGGTFADIDNSRLSIFSNEFGAVLHQHGS